MYRVGNLGYAYHPRSACGPGICAAHKPSKTNPMRKWKFVVRLDKGGLMERFCPHGIGHTDPDSLDWLMEIAFTELQKQNVLALSWHGCDGCCAIVES